MMRPRKKAAAVVLATLMLACGPASAERFIDSPYERGGFAAGLALGPAALLSFGIGDFSGAGAGLSLRVGTTAGERFMWWLQVDSDTYLIKKKVGEGTAVNGQSLATIAGQVFFRDALWLKAGAGFANQFVRDGRGGENQELSTGLGLFGSGGIEFLRRSRVALNIEITVGVGIHAEGAIAQGGIRLGFTYY